MAKWARISTEDNSIKEFVDFDPTGVFPEDEAFAWTEIPTKLEGWLDESWQGDVVDGEVHFSPRDVEYFLTLVKARIASVRWTYQVRGMIIDGSIFKTNPDDLNILNSAISGGTIYEQLNGPGTFFTDWETVNGFVTLSLAQLIGVGLFGLQYTQACFTRARVIRDSMEAAMAGQTSLHQKVIAAIDTYDIEINLSWPNNSNAPPPPVEP